MSSTSSGLSLTHRSRMGLVSGTARLDMGVRSECTVALKAPGLGQFPKCVSARRAPDLLRQIVHHALERIEAERLRHRGPQVGVGVDVVEDAAAVGGLEVL